MKGKEILKESIKAIGNLFQKEKEKRKEKKDSKNNIREEKYRRAISKHSLLFYTPSAICLFDQVSNLSLKAPLSSSYALS
jgi:ABC-type enterochelin transport system substrate-binding protein